MTAITFFHIGAASGAIGIALLAYGLFPVGDGPILIRPRNKLTGFALGACAISATCTLIIYGGYVLS